MKNNIYIYMDYYNKYLKYKNKYLKNNNKYLKEGTYGLWMDATKEEIQAAEERENDEILTIKVVDLSMNLIGIK